MQVLVTIPVEAPDGSDPSEVAAAINKMLDVGAADASDTVDDKDIDDGGEAEFVTKLSMAVPTAVDVTKPIDVWITWTDSFRAWKEHAQFSTQAEVDAFLEGIELACEWGDHWKRHDTEAAADAAVAEHNGDELPGDIVDQPEFNADPLHANVDAGRYTHFEHRQGAAQLKDDLVAIFGEDTDWGVSRLLGLPRESVGKAWFHDVINDAHKLVSLQPADALVLPQYHLCGNCSSAWTEEQLVLPMADLDQRLDPGSEVPSGDCPLCGAFCYICEKPK